MFRDGSRQCQKQIRHPSDPGGHSGDTAGVKITAFRHGGPLVTTCLAGILLSIAALAAPVIAIAPAAQPGSPRLMIGSPELLNTTGRGGDVLHYSFLLRNAGNKTLQIYGAQPDCSCEITGFDETIRPGATGKVDVDLQTQPLSSSIHRKVRILTNDPNHLSVELSVVARVAPVYSVTPSSPVSLSYTSPQPLKQVFVVRFNGVRGNLLSHRIALSGPATVSIKPDPHEPDLFRVTMTVAPPRTGGDVTAVDLIPTSIPGLPPVRLVVLALGTGGVSVEPQEVNFGSIPYGAGRRRLITVFSRTKQFHITQLKTDDPQLTASFSPLGISGSAFMLLVSYSGAWSHGEHKGVIHVDTDLPGSAPLTLPYSAAVE